MPKKAPAHIQKMQPGPPRASAAPTPTMLPTPIVPPSAVLTAAKGETPPASRFCSSEPTVPFRMAGRRVSGRKPVPTVK